MFRSNRSYTVGLDLGQARDYSALAVVEDVLKMEGPSRERTFEDGPHEVTYKHVVHLQRWELGTPYPSIVEDVGALLSAGPDLAEAWLLVDAGGVGRGVMDMFREAFQEGNLGNRWPVPVTLTSGRASNGYNVSKLELVSSLQAALQTGRLKVPDGIPLGEQLARELLAFRAKITGAGTATFEADREGADHDDLVIAVALGVWHRRRSGAPRWLDEHDRVHTQALPG